VRIPAAHCGIVGFKPTYGLSSIRGIVPLGVSYDHVGPMCRTVEDAALLLQAMAGYDRHGISSIDATIPDYTQAMNRRTTSFRLGIPRAMFFDEVDPQISAAVQSAIDVLAELTDDLVDVELPATPEAPLVFPEAFAFHKELLETHRELYDPNTLERILRGVDFPLVDYVEGRYQLEVIRKSIAAVFDEVDLLVTPTLPELPISIEEAAIGIADEALIRNTLPFNVYGIPSISIPCGFSREGWPIGLQISGPRLGELNVLALAHAYEQATDWHERQPSL
jgi:aspartyl-tRNA(Asn)/glutamyl-tRNA(Gln) amidotransferase subunit A